MTKGKSKMSKKVKKSISEVTEVASANFEAFKAEAEYMTDVCGKKCRRMYVRSSEIIIEAKWQLHSLRPSALGERFGNICREVLFCILGDFFDRPELIAEATYAPVLMDGRTDLSLTTAMRQLRKQIAEMSRGIFSVEDIFAIFQICATYDFDILGAIRNEVKRIDTPEIHRDFHYYF